MLITTSHNAIIPFKAIGTSISAGNAADGYGSGYHAIARWRLLQLELVSHRPPIGGHQHVQRHQYLIPPRLTQVLSYSFSGEHETKLDIESDVGDIGVSYLEVDAERLKIVRPCELRRHPSETRGVTFACCTIR